MKRGPRSSESEQSHDNSNSEEVGGMARGAGSKRTVSRGSLTMMGRFLSRLLTFVSVAGCCVTTAEEESQGRDN